MWGEPELEHLRSLRECACVHNEAYMHSMCMLQLRLKDFRGQEEEEAVLDARRTLSLSRLRRFLLSLRSKDS